MDWNKIMSGIGEREIIGVFEYENTEDIKEGSERCLEFMRNLIK